MNNSERVYFGVYFINSDLRVVNSTTGKVLKEKNHKSGYRCVCLTINGKRKMKMVHRLIAESFISNPKNLNEVNHLDGNKSNNKIKNLEWCTHQQNIQHAFDTGLAKGASYFGEDNGHYKGELLAKNTSTGVEFKILNLSECVKYNFNKAHVSSCLTGKLKQHKGHTFRRED